jgi:hypothetical protein
MIESKENEAYGANTEVFIQWSLPHSRQCAASYSAMTESNLTIAGFKHSSSLSMSLFCFKKLTME